MMYPAIFNTRAVKAACVTVLMLLLPVATWSQLLGTTTHDTTLPEEIEDLPDLSDTLSDPTFVDPAFSISLTGTDVAVAGNGTIFYIGTDSSSIMKWSSIGNSEKLPGGAARIAVSPTAQPWVVNANGQIYRWNQSNSWDLLPGGASDIGIGPDGTVWVIGGGGLPYRWDNDHSKWIAGSGGGKQIAVDANGNPWVVNANGQVWKFEGSWSLLPGLPSGTAADIGISGTNVAYVIGSDGITWKWTGAWTRVNIPMKPNGRIGVGQFVYVISPDGGVGASLSN